MCLYRTNLDGTLVSKANIYGDTSIKTLEGLKLENATSEAYIDGTFTGELEVTGDAAQIKAGADFTSLETVKSITKAGTSGATSAYYDGTAFGWADIPTLAVVTDAGTYMQDTTTLGVIRYKTTFTKVTGASVASYGIYALGTNAFDTANGIMDENRAGYYFGSITADDDKKVPAAEKKFYVDVKNIPEDNFDSTVYATHFVKFKGIDAPWYSAIDSVSVNTAAEKVKDLGTYVPKAA